MERYRDSHLCQCSNCSFIFSKQVPSQSELDEFYDTHYDRTSYFSPITRKRYEEWLDMFEPFRKTGNILDIGCGYGFFLEVAKEKGWNVFGLEVSERASEDCKSKGITMFSGELKDAPFTPESFDIIISIEVIEHLIDPDGFLKGAHKLLREGGGMYVTTPNFNSYLRYKLKEKFDVIDYPNHLCYFTNKTLRKIFEENGFKTKFIKTTGMSITRSKTSKGKSNQEYVSETSDDEMLRFKIEKNALLRGMKHVLNAGLTGLKTGHNAKGFFIKPEK